MGNLYRSLIIQIMAPKFKCQLLAFPNAIPILNQNGSNSKNM